MACVGAEGAGWHQAAQEGAANIFHPLAVIAQVRKPACEAGLVYKLHYHLLCSIY